MRYRYQRIEPTGALRLKLLFRHPMRGFNKDPLLSLYIDHISLFQNGSLVYRIHPSVAVSSNPFFRIDLAGIQPGDELEIQWQDNLDNIGREAFIVEEAQ